jgi:hypothetical protein
VLRPVGRRSEPGYTSGRWEPGLRAHQIQMAVLAFSKHDSDERQAQRPGPPLAPLPGIRGGPAGSHRTPYRMVRGCRHAPESGGKPGSGHVPQPPDRREAHMRDSHQPAAAPTLRQPPESGLYGPQNDEHDRWHPVPPDTAGELLAAFLRARSTADRIRATPAGARAADRASITAVPGLDAAGRPVLRLTGRPPAPRCPRCRPDRSPMGATARAPPRRVVTEGESHSVSKSQSHSRAPARKGPQT